MKVDISYYIESRSLCTEGKQSTHKGDKEQELRKPLKACVCDKAITFRSRKNSKPQQQKPNPVKTWGKDPNGYYSKEDMAINYMEKNSVTLAIRKI